MAFVCHEKQFSGVSPWSAHGEANDKCIMLTGIAVMNVDGKSAAMFIHTFLQTQNKSGLCLSRWDKVKVLKSLMGTRIIFV